MGLEWESLLIGPEGDAASSKAISTWAFYLEEKTVSSKAVF